MNFRTFRPRPLSLFQNLPDASVFHVRNHCTIFGLMEVSTPKSEGEVPDVRFRCGYLDQPKTDNNDSSSFYFSAFLKTTYFDFDVIVAKDN